MNTLTSDQQVAGEATSASYTESAQQHVEQLRALRESLPNLTIPVSTRAGQALASVSGVPPEFVQIVSMAMKNHPALAKGGVDADAIRDLSSFATAYDPVADEFEATAHFLRHSITVARHKAGKAALLGYEVAKRLAEDPENAGLAEYVADMARALGFRVRAAKAKANKRKAEAAGAATTPAVTPSKP